MSGLTGPEFGSYAPEDVTWLLKDLSNLELEMSLLDRERTVRDGGHYSEYLPQEYQPSEAYFATYTSALEKNSVRTAEAVASVSEQVLRLRGRNVVLVSLARAGTPVAVLMKRWYANKHNLDVPHYAVSIVRDKGIDANALRYILDHHEAKDIMFVDGWTGKGVITKELQAAVSEFNEVNGEAVPVDVAVLADPAYCVDIYGTREDFLIPSACLNSTVSGLVSRTVLRDDLIGPEDFHGAKFYAELAPYDVSEEFVERIVEIFQTLDVPDVPERRDAPDWSGWDSLKAINEEFGIDDMNLNKPGIGETTRSLLRRMPWKILVNIHNTEDISHITTLAEERGVEVVSYDLAGLPYNCVSILKPDHMVKGE